MWGRCEKYDELRDEEVVVQRSVESDAPTEIMDRDHEIFVKCKGLQSSLVKI